MELNGMVIIILLYVRLNMMITYHNVRKEEENVNIILLQILNFIK
jgi:hypothetical protein